MIWAPTPNLLMQGRPSNNGAKIFAMVHRDFFIAKNRRNDGRFVCMTIGLACAASAPQGGEAEGSERDHDS